MEADTAAVGKVGGGVSVRIGRVCRVKDIIRVSPLGAGDPSRVYQTCVQICFQNREMPRFPFVLSHSSLQKNKSVGLHQIGTTEINLSHASFGDILYPPIPHLFIIQVWAVRSELCGSKCNFPASADATKAAGTRRRHWHIGTPVNIPRHGCLP